MRTAWKRIFHLILIICLAMSMSQTMSLATEETAPTALTETEASADLQPLVDPMAPVASGVNTKKVSKAVIDYSNV